MTLKFTEFLTNALKKQAKISHWSEAVYVNSPKFIKKEYKDLIKKQFGDIFLNDANYVIVTAIDHETADFKKNIKKFANLVGQVLDITVAPSEVHILDTSADAAPTADENPEVNNDVEDAPQPGEEADVPADQAVGEAEGDPQTWVLGFIKLTMK